MQQVFGVGSRLKHAAFGEGVVIRLHQVAYEICFMTYGIKLVGKDYDNWEVIEAIVSEESVTFTEMEKALARILKAWSDITEVIPIGDRWKGGAMILKPSDNSLKEKEVPIETFFHKIVMVRDRLRVMEQRINAHQKMSDSEKVDLQQYITRIYGSLTTFNVLFRNKEDYFVGDKGE